MDTHTFLLETVLEKLSTFTDTVEMPPTTNNENSFFDRFFIDRLPCNSRDELLNFEEFLRKNPAMKTYLVKRFSLAGGLNPRMLSSRVLDMFFTPKCLQQMCWVGTAEKGSFRLLVQVLEILSVSVSKAFPNDKTSTQIMESMLRSKIKNAEAKVLNDAKKDVAQILTGALTTKHLTEY